MVATVAVFIDTAGTNGNPSTITNVTALSPVQLRFKTADNATIDNADPIPIPASGNVNSFWKSIYLECTVAGGFTQIDNVKFYTAGVAFGTGIVTNVGDEMPTHNSGSNSGYVLATGTIGADGAEIVASYTGITAKTNAFSFTAGGTQKTVSISEAGNIINAVGESTNYLVFQMNVASSAGPGNQSNLTWTYQYDEI